MKRALVVAHPDDESLWFGGIVIAEPGDWTIIACSIPRTDPIRAWKFYDACAVLGAVGRVVPIDETPSSIPLLWHRDINLSAFDQVVTHGAAGEYGHAHHKAVHRHIVKECAGRTLIGCYGSAPGPHRIELTPAQWGRKAAAVAAYDHVSPTDGKPKGEALMARYGAEFDLKVETYARA